MLLILYFHYSKNLQNVKSVLSTLNCITSEILFNRYWFPSVSTIILKHILASRCKYIVTFERPLKNNNLVEQKQLLVTYKILTNVNQACCYLQYIVCFYSVLCDTCFCECVFSNVFGVFLSCFFLNAELKYNLKHLFY